MIIKKTRDKVYPWGIVDEDEVVIAKVLTKEEAEILLNGFKAIEMRTLLVKIRDGWSAHMEKLPAEYMNKLIDEVLK